MPLPFEFEGKGLNSKRIGFFSFSEPNSVLDTTTTTSPSPQTSTSTLSGGGKTAAVAAVSGNKWPQDSTSGGADSGSGGSIQIPAMAPPPDLSGGGGAVVMEDWENQEQEQSILRWIMGDVEDPSMGLNKLLQNPNPSNNPLDLDFNGGFSGSDQVFGNDPVDNFPQITNPFNPNPQFHQKSNLSPNPNINQNPQFFNPQLLINHHQPLPLQNPQFFLPQHEQNLFLPPPKRLNHGGNPNPPPLEPPHHHHHLQFLSPKMTGGEEMGQQQAIIDQIYKAAELIQTGNSVLAQGILARLNHHLSSPIGKPFYRASFYTKEALNLLINNNNSSILQQSNSTPFNLILKIGAFKSFSEISPLLQFANFTCNQAILEALEGSNRVHIIDFDIGYGGQWASLMQELALRGNGPPSLKITAFASPLTHDQIELGLTRENLIHFSGEINMPFEFEILNLDLLSSSTWSLPFHCSDNEAIAINLPINSFAIYQLPLPLIMRFIKRINPKIIVSTDRGSDRTDLPFPNHVIHTLQSYSNLLESLDAVNVNIDALQKIERLLFHPNIEKIVLGRYRTPEKTPHWRTVFLSSGLSPLVFSNMTESQADCLIKRTPVRGFHIEKRQSSLVLCWQRKELVSVSAWRC